MKVKGFSRIPPPVSLGEWLLQPCSTQSTLVHNVEQVICINFTVVVCVSFNIGNIALVISSCTMIANCYTNNMSCSPVNVTWLIRLSISVCIAEHRSIIKHTVAVKVVYQFTAFLFSIELQQNIFRSNKVDKITAKPVEKFFMAAVKRINIFLSNSWNCLYKYFSIAGNCKSGILF